MTASNRTPADPQEPDGRSKGRRATTSSARSPRSPLERARAAARKLLGRDRDKAKKDDPNIYPLF